MLLTLFIIATFLFFTVFADRLWMIAPQNLPEYEINALHDFYVSTNGDAWHWSDDDVRWSFEGDPNPCTEQWTGIKCDDQSTGLLHVTNLALPAFHLVGNIPDSILNLTVLNDLNLYSNILSGTIPQSLGNLTSLTYLNLSGNSFNGSIPASLGNLTSLEYLGLYSNILSGTIPPSLGNLTSLLDLILSWNSLNGSIPASLGSLTSLKYLDLYSNILSGTIPPSLGNLTSLTYLDLSWNGLNGSIPSSLGRLTSLQYVDLYSNFLSGTIPPSLGNLTSLTYLDLSWNSLNGSIPASLGSLTTLVYLDLYSNILSGTIPPSLGNLTSLTYLDLSWNSLNGSIPSSLGSLTSLLYLDLYSNILSATIPPSLGNLTSLTYLDLGGNSLNGSIPSSLSSLTSLQYLDLYSNILSSTIPPSLGNLTSLLYLVLSWNSLNGSIPSSLGRLTSLKVLYLYSNILSSTIPPSLGSLTSLQYLDLHSNILSSTIPPSLGNLTSLLYLVLSWNSLNGPIPSSLGMLTSLKGLYLYSNILSSTIPPSLGNLTSLTYLDLGGNSINGIIPVSLGNLTFLQYLDFSNNYLAGTLPDNISNFSHLGKLQVNNNILTGTLPAITILRTPGVLSFASNRMHGTIPASYANLHRLTYLSVATNSFTDCIPGFGRLENLKVLLLSNNEFSCSLDGVFNSAIQKDLFDVEVGNNRLTGTLPAELFRLPQLTTLVAAKNCFTGTISTSVCERYLLKTLILDGLHSAKICRPISELDPHNPHVNGVIPGCLLSLPNMTSLHLSGNSFDGYLPDNATPGTNFTQLILSHNTLQGSIPLGLQNHTWYLFDLSYNRFTGSLTPTFGESMVNLSFNNLTAMINVSNNRISGKIPHHLINFAKIELLGSNMFSCKTDKSDIPDSDSNNNRDKLKYQCGSDAFNYSFYIFLGLTFATCILVVYLSYYSKRTSGVAMYLDKWRLPKGSLPLSCQHVHTMVGILCQVAVYTTALILLVLVPWYAIASHYWGTYTHQYAWVVSAAFLSGLTPGLTDMFLQSALVLAVATITATITLRTEKDERAFASRRSTTTADTAFAANVPLKARAGAYAVFLVLNLGIVGCAHFGFIMVSLRYSDWQVQLAGIALSLFKSVWNVYCVPRLSYAVAKYFKIPVKKSGGFFRVQAFFGLFNNVAIPCVVVAAQSPSCFYNILHRPNPVVSNYYAQICTPANATISCALQPDGVQQTEYRPAFTYYYQCSSSFITYYASSLIIFALTPIVGVPLLYVTMRWVIRHTSPAGWLHRTANKLLPRLWKDLDPPTEGSIPVAEKGIEKVRGTYLDAGTLLVNMNIYLGLLLTFGVAFPPIAVAMCATILSEATQTKLLVGRLLCAAREAGRQDVVDTLERDCAQVASLQKLKSVVMTSIVFGCYFYALFVFDTVGDAKGFSGAYWVLILMGLVPACVYGYVRLRREVGEKRGVVRELGFSMDGFALEMTEMEAKDEGGLEGEGSLKIGETESSVRGVAGSSEEPTISALHEP